MRHWDNTVELHTQLLGSILSAPCLRLRASTRTRACVRSTLLPRQHNANTLGDAACRPAVGAVAGSCVTYTAMTTPMSQADAQTACEADGGNLASIHSDADQEAARAACNSASGNTDGYDSDCWIGLSDTATEGTFVWTDGTPNDYQHWNPGEPNAWASQSTCTETAAISVTADAAACAAACSHWCRSPTCAAVMTAADGTVAACTYSEGLAAGEPLNDAPDCRGADQCTNCPSRCNVAGSLENGVNIRHNNEDGGSWNDQDPAGLRPFICGGTTASPCAYTAPAVAQCYTVPQNVFYGVSTLATTTDAEADCVANGGKLASLHSDVDHWASMQACNAVSAAGNCWIGLSDSATEGTFVWSDGSATDYENWAAGEPNAWTGSRTYTGMTTPLSRTAAEAAVRTNELHPINCDHAIFL